VPLLIFALRKCLTENAIKTVWSLQLQTLSKEKFVSVLIKNAEKDLCLIKETRKKFKME
jgi:hypothetical protein